MSPTKLRLENIFSGAQIPDELSRAVVYKTNASASERTMVITIASEELISYGVIEDFKKYIKDKYKLASFLLKVKYINTDLENLSVADYYKNLVFYVNEVISGVRHLFLDSTAELDGSTFTVHCRYGTGLLGDMKCAEVMERLIFSQTGEKVTVVFADESDASELDRALEKTLSELPEIVVAEPKHEVTESPSEPTDVIMGKAITEPSIPISDISEDMRSVIISGKIIYLDDRELKSEKTLVKFYLADNDDAYTCKAFFPKGKFKEAKGRMKAGKAYVKVKGRLQYDSFDRENIIMVNDICESKPSAGRMDNADEKRVELHMHTKMSAMDAMTDAEVLVKNAISWGHKAVAITDHGNVQAFPEAYHAAGDKIKILYGVECYLVNDTTEIVFNPIEKPLDTEYVVFDLETTGFSPNTEEIIEIGAAKVKNGQVVDTFDEFVNPGRPIPPRITELTSITDNMVEDADPIEKVLPRFYEFAGDAILVAHNAAFDTSFVRKVAKRCGLAFDFCYMDTLELARCTVKGVKNYKLNTLTKHFGVKLENHHRASDDAIATAHVLLRLLANLEDMGVETVDKINSSLAGNVDIRSLKMYHCILLVQTQEGMRNLYNIISKSHLDYFYKKPRVPKSLIKQYREGLLVGSACEAGELYRAILDDPYGFDINEINKIINFYDYLEIQPLGNNNFLLRNGTLESIEDLKNINRTIIDLGKRNNKLTVATCDVHFMNPEDEVFRRILQAGQGYGDADEQPPLYFRTTKEMLSEFDYLGDELAKEVVITNPNIIADMIDVVKPVPDDKAPPEIPGSDEELQKLTYDKAKSIYGDNLPDIVKDRIDIELNSIISNGYSVLYIIAQKLVWKSNSDGYLVGSRGSVGSSLVAFMSGITEVNSLPPHYVCPKCKHNEFITDGSVGCGYDMPDKACPECGEMMIKDGHDIPFQTFLGFYGDKEPDIDLNFSGDYQPRAHKYIEELFGTGHVFRAGTIGTVAEKTAYGYVMKYYESKGMHITQAQAQRLLLGCTGVKRTTGQHPGGIIVVPKNRDVHEFSPIQHPADDINSDIITLHFDYHSIDKNLLKLDILGHDDPTVIRMLEDLTGLDAHDIRIDDQKTMSLFTGTEALGVKPEDINSPVGTFAVPEFGTKFVRQMLVDTKPTTFSELVRISGLSHGTDVWLNNAQTLIKEGKTTLGEAICTRDDIMVYLIYKGVEKGLAFKIMESVRKGRGLSPEFEQAMRDNNVPDWYIGSCKKIKYMFPKAHAVAYVTMAFRIAYFKVYYPMEFYCTYFTVRADEFDAEIIACGREQAIKNMRMYEAKDRDKQTSDKEKNLMTILEVAIEMYARGLNFLPIDLEKSHSYKFIPTPNGILPPLNAIAGLGTNAAKSIVDARDEAPFASVEDFAKRAKVTKTIVEIMRGRGMFNNLPESDQVTFF